MAASVTFINVPIVERPGRKPHCLAGSPPPFSMAAVSRGFKSVSSSFPDISTIHSGLYADGTSGSTFSLLIKIYLCFFHISGKMHSLSHALYIPIRSSGLVLAISRITSDGMLARPSALPGFSSNAATFNSSAENGKNSVLSVFCSRSFTSS